MTISDRQDASTGFDADQDIFVEATSLLNRAEAKLLERSQDSLALSNRAATLFHRLGERRGEALATLALSSAHELFGNVEASLKAARDALLLARQSGDPEIQNRARATCARLREVVARPLQTTAPKLKPDAVRRKQPIVGATRIVGSAETKRLCGLVTLVTGASRGLGKGIALALAEAGAVVYVTGRSSPGKESDVVLMGSVDETASMFSKLGGTGVAVHVDHAQDEQNQALAKLIENTHGRLDVLVNSAFYVPKPDMLFFNTPIWNQPLRFLNEQTMVGSMNHMALTLSLLSCLKRGKGLVVNISSWGSQLNIGIFPSSYLCNKAQFDQTSAALSEKLRSEGIYVITLWPGNVRSERSVMGAKRTGTLLIDLETTRFTGHAVVTLAAMRPDVLRDYTAKHQTVSSADIESWDVDGYLLEGNLHTFSTGGRSY